MKTKQTIALISSSALTAGMAKGAVLYSGTVNYQFPCSGATVPAESQGFDVNGDGLDDFYVGFDGYGSPNVQKPFVGDYPSADPGSAAQGVTVTDAKNDIASGVPVTQFGTMIDANHLTPDLQPNVNNAYFNYLYQDNNGDVVGNWPSGAKTEGYVGLEVYDGSSSTTNFAWVRLIYDDTGSPATITVVDYACEMTPSVGIPAGATNDFNNPAPPQIYASPVSATVPAFASVQLSVIVLADPAPTYQWQAGAVGSHIYTNLSDGGVISGAQTATLTNSSITLSADYVVVATNSLGKATSSPATLTVVQPVATPTPQVLFAGFPASFNVSIGAGLTPTFQWQCAGTNLANGGRFSGGNTRQLQIGNLQTTDSGGYSLVLTKGSLTVTSSVSALTVLPVTSASTYDLAVMAARPVAYYRLLESGNPLSGNLVAYDNAHSYNGVYGVDVTNGFAGIAGPRPVNGFPGFPANNAAAQFADLNDTNCWITLVPWNLNTNSATLTAWINPANLETDETGIVATGTTNDTYAGMQYHFVTNSYASAAGIYDLGYRWDDGGNGELWDSGIASPTNEWSLMAVVIAPTNSSLYLFNTNGVQAASTYADSFFPNGFTNLTMAFNNPEYIGTDPTDQTGGRNFTGGIGPVAIFDGALSSNQLQTLYNAALGILPANPPRITSVRLSGTSLVIDGTGGGPGLPFVLLTSTSVSQPLSEWTPLYTSTFAGSTFSVTIPVNPNAARSFYSLRAP